MTLLSIAITILSTALLIQTQKDPQFLHLKKVELRDSVTLNCTVLKNKNINEEIYWYKQSLGYNPQMVASRYFTSKIYPPFILRFKVGNGSNFNLTISNVQKEDEANYFCNQGGQYLNIWNNGVFLTVKDPNDQRFVSQTVVQQPVSASAQLGDPVALQCSITSQRTDHSNQCQGEPSVYWFRSGPSHPAAIYMNGNRSGECQNSSGPSAPQSCVYTLPKNNVDSSDAGTYYCALAACGEVVFGNGTKLDITDDNAQRFVSQTVVQQPVSASAQLGDPVALQCSITSQRTDHSNQCQGEPSVYWFRGDGRTTQLIGELRLAAIKLRPAQAGQDTDFMDNPNDQRFVSQTVVQQPVSASAQLGDPVALQCSITSQRTDHSNQCQGEPSVYWFRSGPSHPAAIYMNGNRRGECQNSSGPPSAPQSCVYTLPKNNVDSSDAGTYYCALAACGEAVFGNGTKLDITDPNCHLVILVHRILLACFLLVIIILILIIHYRTGKPSP
ncbi:unnamed protein product [Gadus morhua 'NCC']